MREVRVKDGFEAWREAARRLIQEGVRPEQVMFVDGSRGPGSLFAESPVTTSSGSNGAPPRVSRGFVEFAERVAMHRDPRRWELLYRVLHRIVSGEPKLLDIREDPDIDELRSMHAAVGRDEHAAHAFVRFRRVVANGETRWIAWHRPQHYIVTLVAPFFARRFSDMRWSLLTPDQSVHHEPSKSALGTLTFGAGVLKRDARGDDPLDELWRAYYRAVFNPARLNLTAMRRDMPMRHWDTLPELRDIKAIVAEAPERVHAMQEVSERLLRADEFLPSDRSIEALREAATRCRGCSLYEPATQVVFGEGPSDARIVMVGEQPGDEEDRRGRPFVGPAGDVLARALIEAAITREQVYVTNAVKHFKYEPRGKKRIHQKPTTREVGACRPWLEAELTAVRPDVLVCLGATAAMAILGATFRVTKERGVPRETAWARVTLATWHPSAILRARTPEERDTLYRELVADLRGAQEVLSNSG